MAGTPQNLTDGRSVVLDGTGAGQVGIGPGATAGPAYWHVTSIVTQTNRPGVAPIPRVSLYLNSVAPENVLAVSYDGSFGQANGDQELSRGQQIIAAWSGGQAGDRATITVNGTKWS